MKAAEAPYATAFPTVEIPRAKIDATFHRTPTRADVHAVGAYPTEPEHSYREPGGAGVDAESIIRRHPSNARV